MKNALKSSWVKSWGVGCSVFFGCSGLSSGLVEGFHGVSDARVWSQEVGPSSGVVGGIGGKPRVPRSHRLAS